MPIRCNEYFKPCGDQASAELTCENSGLCCEPEPASDHLSPACVCLPGWTGNRCQEYDFEMLASMQRSSMELLRKSTVLSLCIALIAFIALSVIIFIVVKKSKKRTEWKKLQQTDIEKLTRSLSQVQEEIEKLPKADNLTHINRLTKLVEVSCLTGGAVILKTPYSPPPRPSFANDCLPRWSSAPNGIDRVPVDSPDGTDGALLTAERRKKLQHVFSLPETEDPRISFT